MMTLKTHILVQRTGWRPDVSLVDEALGLINEVNQRRAG